MSVLVLMEAVPDEFDIEPGDTVVPLTPVAYAELRRRGIPFETLGDAAEDKLCDASAFWADEVAWLDALDDALASRLPDVQARELRPAILSGYFLKTCVDVVFVRGVELSTLLDRGAFNRVVFHREDIEQPMLDYTLSFLGGPSVLSRLLPLFAQARNFEYEERLLRPTRAAARVEAGRRRFAIVWRLALASIQAAEVAAGFGRRALTRDRRLTMLLASRYYDLNALLRAARRRGHRCLLRMADGRVIDVSRLRSRTVGTLLATLPRERFEVAADELTAQDAPLWEWPDSWFGLPVSEILAPPLRFWIAEVLPVLFELSSQALGLLERERVDYLVVPHLTALEDFAVVDAARFQPATEAIQIEHGDGPLGLPVWDLLDLFHFDRYFATSSEAAEYFRNRATLYTRATARIEVGSYRWQAGSQRAGRRGSAPEPVADGRPLVIYGLGLIAGDARYLGSDWRPDVWYYELETTLIDLMSRDERYVFIVKTFPGPGHLHAPIAEFVEGLARSHVQVSTRRFVEWLPAANRVVLDAASTAVYETALARVPFLSLADARLQIRKGAGEILGPSLVSFRTIEEAADHVRTFLDDPNPFVPTVVPEGADILTTLERLRDYTRHSA